jgi:DNA-binding transcriptional LysR family regulator
VNGLGVYGSEHRQRTPVLYPDAFASHSKLVYRAQRKVPRERVRVNCPINFAQILAAGAIVDFLTDRPEIEGTLDVSHRDVDVLADGYDLVVRVGTNIKSPNLIVRALAVTRHWFLARSALIARCGAPH